MTTKKIFNYLFGALLLVITVGFSNPNVKKRVVIDAGHGGTDKGVIVDKISEKQIVEAISNKIKEHNSEENLEIILLRNGDKLMGVKERVEAINKIKPDLVVSLHVNYSNDKEKSGPSIYISKKNMFYEQSLQAAEMFNAKLNISQEILHSNFHILNNSKCPAISVELGYLSNTEERENLMDEKYQLEIAEKILGAVL